MIASAVNGHATRWISCNGMSALLIPAPACPVVGAALAITAQLESLIPTDMQIIGEEHGLPTMLSTSIVLLRNPQAQTPITDCLAEYIAEGFRL